MIPFTLARELRDAGLVWKPVPGDRFAIPDRGLDDEVFVVSNMTIEVHDVPNGSVIGFNGTVEWAMDDVAKEEAVWLPREDQLRELFGAAFRRLERDGERYRVLIGETSYEGDSPEQAYGLALLNLLAPAEVDA
jgi:hypothetical protein